MIVSKMASMVMSANVGPAGVSFFSPKRTRANSRRIQPREKTSLAGVGLGKESNEGEDEKDSTRGEHTLYH